MSLAEEDRTALDAGKGFIRMCKPLVDSISTLEWKPGMGFWTVLCRCVVRRQYDALESIVESVDREHGHSTVPLLRPACEEYLWIKFLRTIDQKSRETIILAKSQMEAADTLENQASFMSSRGMTELGFRSDFIKHMVTTKAHSERQMKALGTKLKWNLKRGLFPSVAAIARKVNEQRTYKMIYSATSRAVHFNIAELLRRAWGNKEQLTISSGHMNRYWSHFCLYWGWGLFALTTHEIADEFNDNNWPIADFADSKEMEKLIEDWAKMGPVPIITAEEMNQDLAPGVPSFS